MDNLRNKLGAQGTDLLQTQLLYPAIANPPSELDFLLNGLVSADYSVDKLTSYLAYYYPKLKSKRNIELLTTTLFRSSIFKSIDSLSIQVNSRLTDCFQYIISEKYKITNPTVSFIDFYKSIYNALCLVMQVDSNAFWKTIPVLTGCISSLSQIESYNPFPAYSNVLHQTHKLYLLMYANSINYLLRLNLSIEIKDSYLLSLVYAQEYINESMLQSLALASPSILSDITKMLFLSPYGLDNGMCYLKEISYNQLMQQTPVLRSLNKWAFLYSKLANFMNLQQIADSISHVTEFSTRLEKTLEAVKNNTDKWDLVKYTFFTIMLIFERVMKSILKFNKFTDIAFVICSQIQRSQFYLSFILDQIGIGGFDSYNFVFDTSSCIFQKNPQLVNNLEYSLLNELALNNSLTNEVEKSKLDYFLRLTEAVLPTLNELFLTSSLFPLLQKILTTQNYTISTVEFAHSIMIKYISMSKASPIIFSYFDRALYQFPTVISLHQASLITQACGIKTDSATSLFDLVKFHVAMSPYTPLPARKTVSGGYAAIIPEKLNSRKAGFISLLIDLVQFIESEIFVFSLNEIKSLIDGLIGDRDIYTLYDLLWDKILLVNKYDTWKGQTGIAWWYDNVNNGQVPKL